MLAKEDWRVAIIGRREETLRETIALAGAAAPRLASYVCDIGQTGAVTQAANAILKQFGTVQTLVNAAGTNVPQRSFEVLSEEDYHRILDANLNGAYYCTQAFLPSMRRARAGTIINIVSDAGKQASPKSGPAYVISKFGLAGFTQSINAEERAQGIRACAIFPGDIDTPLLDKRPQPPDAASRRQMLQPEDVAECVRLVIHLPQRAIVEEILIRPR
jgi:NAD(P)-dependent dehydrogenase (short-subunit alcohol dehydrogenase family)